MWVQVDSSDIAILTTSYHDIVSDGYQGIHAVRVSWELVRVKSILVLTGKNKSYLMQIQ